MGEHARRVLRAYGEEAGESAIPVQMHFIEAVPHLQGTHGWQSSVRAASKREQIEQQHPKFWLDQTKHLAGSRAATEVAHHDRYIDEFLSRFLARSLKPDVPTYGGAIIFK